MCSSDLTCPHNVKNVDNCPCGGTDPDPNSGTYGEKCACLATNDPAFNTCAWTTYDIQTPGTYWIMLEGLADYEGEYSFKFTCSTVPSPAPTPTPTFVPTTLPTPLPTNQPTPLPTSVPTYLPTSEPTIIPTPEPTMVPTPQPTPAPTSQPTPVPTSVPTYVPTYQPTALPTPQPTAIPTPQPTSVPTPSPTTNCLPGWFMTRLHEQVRYDGLEWTDGNGETHPCLGGSSGSNLPGGGDEDGFGHDNRTDNGWKDRWPVVEAPLYRTDPDTGKYILTDLGDNTAPVSGGKEVIGTRGRRYKIGDASKGTLLGATKAAHIIQNSAQAMDKCASHIIKTDADLVAAGMNPDRETTTCHVCEPGRFTTGATNFSMGMNRGMDYTKGLPLINNDGTYSVPNDGTDDSVSSTGQSWLTYQVGNTNFNSGATMGDKGTMTGSETADATLGNYEYKSSNVGLPGSPSHGGFTYDGDNRNFKHSQHYWTLKPGSSGQQYVPDGEGPDGEWHKSSDSNAHLTPYTKINGFDIEAALLAGDKHHPSLGWRPENASFHTDAQYRINNPDIKEIGRAHV